LQVLHCQDAPILIQRGAQAVMGGRAHKPGLEIFWSRQANLHRASDSLREAGGVHCHQLVNFAP
jgi:hypothetical protein